MFFRTKIKPDTFANCLLKEHQAIFGKANLDRLCKQLGFCFRDESSYIEGFFELQAFGLYSIASGVRTQCGQDLRAVILPALNERFKSVTGPNWEIMRHRVDEYEEFSWQGPTGSIAAKTIFDKPQGVLQPKSQEAFGLGIAMDAAYLDAVKAVERLFKQYKVVE